MDSVEIGKRIKKYRLAKGLTQKQLAELMYTDDKKVSKWETGRVKMDLELITQICNALDISVHDFLDGIEYKQRFTKITKIGKFLWQHIFKIIVIITYLLLLIFFISNYKFMNYYKIKSDSIDVKVTNGVFIESKFKNILVLNDINVYNIDYDILNTSIKLYTYVNGEKYYFYEKDSLEDIMIEELYGYENVFTSKVIDNIKKSLYLTIDITDTDNEIHNYETKLDVIHNFSSNQLAYLKFKELNNEQESENTDFEIDEVKLLKNGFKKDEGTNTYIKDVDKNTNISIDLNYQKITLNIKLKKINTIYTIYNNQKVFQKIEKNMNNETLDYYEYNYENDKLNCYIANCDSYLEDTEYILNLMNTLFK